MAFNLTFGLVVLVLGIGSLWIAMPGKDGQPVRFLRNSNLRFIYSVVPLLLIVVGAAYVFQAI